MGLTIRPAASCRIWTRNKPYENLINVKVPNNSFQNVVYGYFSDYYSAATEAFFNATITNLKNK